MKKLIYALFGCFIAFGAFADGDVRVGDRTISRVRIPVGAVIESLAGESKSYFGKIDAYSFNTLVKQYTEIVQKSPDGKVTTHDMWEFCKKIAVQQKMKRITSVDCYEYFVLPTYTHAKTWLYLNGCLSGSALGRGRGHCIDDVFVKEYDTTHIEVGPYDIFRPKSGTLGVVAGRPLDDPNNIAYWQVDHHVSSKPYAQDVSVRPWTAYGLAIEYLKYKGLNEDTEADIVCSPEYADGWITCTRIDNSDFYTFKFADTQGGMSSETASMVGGLCALFGVGTSADWFRSKVSSQKTLKNYCKINCSNGTKASKVIQKFGFDVYTGDDVDTAHQCVIDWQNNYVFQEDIKTYPNYEYMSYNFALIQTYLNPGLLKMLRKYIELQRIPVSSFDCEFRHRPIVEATHDGSARHQDVIPRYDAIRCTLNGRDVDFLFHDLIETKEITLSANRDAMQCLLLQRKSGDTATFDGKHCLGVGKKLCVCGNTNDCADDACGPGSLCEATGHGAKWNSDAGACVMTEAAALQRLERGAMIIGGTVVAVAITVLSGGTATPVLIELGAGLGLGAAQEWLEKYDEEVAHSAVEETVSKLKKCGVHEKQTYCSDEQNKCTADSAGMATALMLDFHDYVNDDDLGKLDGSLQSVKLCYATNPTLANSIINEKREAAVGILKAKHEWVNKASLILAIGAFIISPRAVYTKITKFPGLNKLAKKAGVKRWVVAEEVTGLRRPIFRGILGKKKSVTINRVDIAKISEDVLDKDDFIRMLERRGISYIDGSTIDVSKITQTKWVRDFMTDPTVSAEERLAMDNAVRMHINNMKNSIYYSNSVTGKMPEIIIPVGTPGNVFGETAFIKPTVPNNPLLQRAIDAGATMFIIRGVDKGGSWLWKLAFGEDDPEISEGNTGEDNNEGIIVLSPEDQDAGDRSRRSDTSTDIGVTAGD